MDSFLLKLCIVLILLSIRFIPPTKQEKLILWIQFLDVWMQAHLFLWIKFQTLYFLILYVGVPGTLFLNATYSCVGIYIVCLQKVCTALKEKNIFSRLVRWFEKLLYDSFFSVPCLSNCASIDAICVSVRAFGCGKQFFISSSYIYFTRSFDAFMIFLEHTVRKSAK